MNEMVRTDPSELMELAAGDLSKLSIPQRNQYYVAVCDSLGLNPLTRPFEYINFQGKLILYARRDAADQLRKKNGINVAILTQNVSDELLTVHVRAVDKSGREDEDFGVVSFPSTLRGEARANALMKAVTKAKRRVTLSISGLGFLDETEVDSVNSMRRPSPPAPNVMITDQRYDRETGEVLEPGIPGFLDRRNSAAVSPAPSADEPAPSQAPTENGAGDDPGPDPKDMFIEECKGKIANSTSARTLGTWWNSDAEKQKRRDFELSDAEVEMLKAAVIARRDALAVPVGGNGK